MRTRCIGIIMRGKDTKLSTNWRKAPFPVKKKLIFCERDIYKILPIQGEWCPRFSAKDLNVRYFLQNTFKWDKWKLPCTSSSSTTWQYWLAPMLNYNPLLNWPAHLVGTNGRFTRPIWGQIMSSVKTEALCPLCIRGHHRQLDDSLVGQLTR